MQDQPSASERILRIATILLIGLFFAAIVQFALLLPAVGAGGVLVISTPFISSDSCSPRDAWRRPIARR